MIAAFSWINWIDQAADLIAGDQSVTLPVGNLADRRVEKCWRSGTSTATFFGADFGIAVEIGVIGLFGCTLTPADTVRLRLSNVMLGDGELLDTTSVAGGVLPNYGQYVYLPASPITARYLQIDIDAPSRTAQGNFDIGRAWAGPIFKPTRSFSPGHGVNWNDDSTVVRSPRSGALFADKTPLYRSRTLTFNWLTEDEKNLIMDMDLAVGQSQQLLFIPDVAGDLARDPLLGHQDKINPITQAVNSVPAVYSRQFILMQDL